MNTLIIDTSLSVNFLLGSKNNYRYLQVLDTDKKQSVSLVASIKQFLSLHDTRLTDIEYFGVGIGPGSFTGTRIGIMCIKTLAYIYQKPIVTFCSLISFSHTFSHFALVSDAKADKLYILKGQYKNGQYSFQEPEVICTDAISQYSHLHLIGPEHLTIKGLSVEKTEINTQVLVDYCMQKFVNRKVEDSKKVLPIYLRDPANLS